jgi:ADP-heptose:LPS heptosyltransferase
MYFNSRYGVIIKLLKGFSDLIIAISPKKKKSQKAADVQEILIVDTHLIGDLVMSTAFIQALILKYPLAQIHIVARTYALDVFLGYERVKIHPFFISNGFEFSKWLKNLKTILRIRKINVDLGINARGDIREIAIAKLCKVERLVSFDFTGGGFLLDDVVAVDSKFEHLFDKYKVIGQYLGLDLTGLKPEIRLTEAEIESVSRVESYIGVHIDASNVLRQLPKAEIFQIFQNFQKTEKVVFFAGPNISVDNINDIKLTFPWVQIWKGNLRAMMVYLSRCRILISADSGQAHIAASLNVVVLILGGPSKLNFTKPMGNNIELLSLENIICSPCNQIECKNSVHQFCFRGIGIIVNQKLNQLIGERDT